MAGIDWQGDTEAAEREKLDWDRLARELAGVEEDHESRDNGWYHALEGNTPYEKLKTLRAKLLTTMEITERSKWWWDREWPRNLNQLGRREGRSWGMS